MKGDGFTKSLRRQIKIAEREYKRNKRLDKKECDRNGGCSDWYDRMREWASDHAALTGVLEEYQKFKGWKK